MKLSEKQWRAVDERMGVLYQEAFHLISIKEPGEEHYNKYIELLANHCEIEGEA